MWTQKNAENCWERIIHLQFVFLKEQEKKQHSSTFGILYLAACVCNMYVLAVLTNADS